MLRVLHVIGAMDRGGAETLIMNLYRSINRKRYQFDFLVHEQRECDFDDEIRELGGNIYRLPRFNGWNYFTYKRLCKEFFAEHREHPIVHGHIGSSAAIYLSEAKKAGRVTIAHSHAQSFLPGIMGMGFKVVTYPTRYIADWFIGCSLEAGRDRYGEKVVAGDRFSILNNGIHVQDYRCDERSHLREKEKLGLRGHPVFGHVGRLAPEKNHRFLIDAFNLVLDQIPDAMLLLAGRGPLEEELKNYVDHLGISTSVVFLGVRDDVPELLRGFDVFVFPSEKEGLGLSAIEAQASGLPTIVSAGVPSMACVTESAVRISLSDGVRAWADEMVAQLRRAESAPRHDWIDDVRSGGFDIDDSARDLIELYEKLRNELKG